MSNDDLTCLDNLAKGCLDRRDRAGPKTNVWKFWHAMCLAIGEDKTQLETALKLDDSAERVNAQLPCFTCGHAKANHSLRCFYDTCRCAGYSATPADVPGLMDQLKNAFDKSPMYTKVAPVTPPLVWDPQSSNMHGCCSHPMNRHTLETRTCLAPNCRCIGPAAPPKEVGKPLTLPEKAPPHAIEQNLVHMITEARKAQRKPLASGPAWSAFVAVLLQAQELARTAAQRDYDCQNRAIRVIHNGFEYRPTEVRKTQDERGREAIEFTVSASSYESRDSMLKGLLRIGTTVVMIGNNELLRWPTGNPSQHDFDAFALQLHIRIRQS